MEKPPAEIVKLLKTISKKCEIPMPDIKVMYEEIYERSPIQNLKVDSDFERQKHAARVLFAEMTNDRDKAKFSGTPVPVTLRIESKSPISDFKKKGSEKIGYRSEMYVTVQDSDENVAIGKLTLWNDANEAHPEFLEGETYTTKCVIGKRGDIWQMSMNTSEDVNESNTELPELKNVVTEKYTPIAIEDVENNISRDQNELKLVEGIVVSGWTMVTAAGNDMGLLKIMGDMDPDETFVAKFSGDTNCVNMFSLGDVVYVLGQTTPAVLNDDGTEKYQVGMWGNLIVPVISIDPRENETEDEEDEEIDDEEDINDVIDESDEEEIDDESDKDIDELKEKIDDW